MPGEALGFSSDGLTLENGRSDTVRIQLYGLQLEKEQGDALPELKVAITFAVI